MIIHKDGIIEIYAPPAFDGSEGLLAFIIPAAYRRDGVQFFSDPNSPQQVGFLGHKTGTVIEPHTHKPIQRITQGTQEVLLVRRGSVLVTFYTSSHSPVCEYVLASGDVLSLVSGGHGFEVLDDCDMIEIKSGPYVGREADKVTFKPNGSHEK